MNALRRLFLCPPTLSLSPRNDLPETRFFALSLFRAPRPTQTRRLVRSDESLEGRWLPGTFDLNEIRLRGSFFRTLNLSFLRRLLDPVAAQLYRESSTSGETAAQQAEGRPQIGVTVGVVPIEIFATLNPGHRFIVDHRYRSDDSRRRVWRYIQRRPDRNAIRLDFCIVGI